MLTNKKNNFTWKLIVVYGPAYENRKLDFLDELEHLMTSWQGPLLIGGDFNLVRFTSDKSNGQINHRWDDLFNN
jgi:exonuclease III